MKQMLSAFLIAAAVAGCGKSSDSPTGPSAGTRLTISSPPNFARPGETFQLTATAGDRNVTPETRWTSLDPTIASVSAGGLVTAMGLGQTTITATHKSLSATITVYALFPATRLQVTGNRTLGDIGDTSQLQAIITLLNGDTADATNSATWIPMTVPSVVGVARGLLTARALGWGQINVTYGPHLVANMVTVAPQGTYLIRGFVKLPGHGGVPDFRVVDTKSGRTTTSSVTGGYSPGWYTLGGLTGSTRITFEKAGFEPAEIVVTGPALNGGGEVKVQQIYRIAAGERVQTTIAPHDVEYAIGPSESCVNCRMIRVVTPAPGTLHLTLTSNMPRALTVWVNGRRFVGLPGGPLEAAVPVSAGEVVLYAGGGPSEDGVYVPLTLTTSFTGAN